MPPKRFEMLTAAGASNLSVRALLAAGEGPDLVREAKEHAPHKLQRHFHGVFPDVDSRYKQTGKETDHDVSRLPFNTSVPDDRAPTCRFRRAVPVRRT